MRNSFGKSPLAKLWCDNDKMMVVMVAGQWWNIDNNGDDGDDVDDGDNGDDGDDGDSNLSTLRLAGQKPTSHWPLVTLVGLDPCR